MLLTYAIYSMATAGNGIAQELKNQPPEVAQMLGTARGWKRQWFTRLGVLAMVAIFGQGGTALFYLRANGTSRNSRARRRVDHGRGAGGLPDVGMKAEG